MIAPIAVNGVAAVAVMVIVCCVEVASVPEPLLIVTVKVKEPSVPPGVPEVPATAAVKIPATTARVVPAEDNASTRA